MWMEYFGNQKKPITLPKTTTYEYVQISTKKYHVYEMVPVNVCHNCVYGRVEE